MTPGWLERAIESTFADPGEDVCRVCANERFVKLVAFNGDQLDEPVPCPACRHTPPPLPIYVYDQRLDTPRGAAR